MLNWRRNFFNSLLTCACWLATFIIIAIFTSIVVLLIIKGVGGLHLSLLTQTTPPPNTQGGLSNAIVGTLLITMLAMLIAMPCAIIIAIYLNVFARNKKLVAVVRLLNDSLLSAPSIITGLFCYTILVAPLHHFSALAGSIALAIIALPIIIRTCEDMLTTIPHELREAALALGAPYWKIIYKVILSSVRQGIVTGILLACARIIGETAPLLFTSLNNQFFSTDITKPMASLPVVIYQYAMSPYQNWQQLAWGGAFIIFIAVLALSILAKKLTKNRIN